MAYLIDGKITGISGIVGPFFEGSYEVRTGEGRLAALLRCWGRRKQRGTGVSIGKGQGTPNARIETCVVGGRELGAQ